VSERLADPVETATGRELLDEVLVTIGDEDGVEESRATGLEGEVRVDDTLDETVSALGTARAAGSEEGERKRERGEERRGEVRRGE
jgi:hypothetical protein